VTPGEALEQVSCNLCGADAATTLFERPYDAGADPARFAATTDEFDRYGRIVKCARCGLVYTNPRPKPQQLLEGYAHCVDEAYLAESSSRSINAHLSLNTIKRFVKTGKLLEVGSAAGYFLNAARVDFDVVGLEPSEWGCKTCRERYKLDVFCEAFETTTRFAPASFDCVAMIDVIEHVTDPRKVLEKAASLLKPGGVLYILTPDIGSLSAKVLGGSWWGLRPAHIYYFDRGTLGRLLRECGFELKLEKSFGRIFSWGYWASRLRNYPRPVTGTIEAMIRWLDWEDKLLYLDTRDAVEVCAVRRP
jgi:SAM-dependent methyltransferase